MNGLADILLHRLAKMSVHQQTLCITGAALAGTNVLVLLFYWIFFEDRLLLDLLLSSIIVIIVGYPLGYLFIGQNMRLREMAVKLDRAARTDDLTGLLNRRSFMSEAGEAIESFGAAESALLYVDIDHFKLLNDTHGHAAGDQVLRELGQAMLDVLPHYAVAARLGGEEFAIFLPGSGPAEARLAAEGIRTGLSVRRPTRTPLITVSVGVATRRRGESLEQLLRAADANLYAAKRQGRDRVVVDLEIAA